MAPATVIIIRPITINDQSTSALHADDRCVGVASVMEFIIAVIATSTIEHEPTGRALSQTSIIDGRSRQACRRMEFSILNRLTRDVRWRSSEEEGLL